MSRNIKVSFAGENSKGAIKIKYIRGSSNVETTPLADGKKPAYKFENNERDYNYYCSNYIEDFEQFIPENCGALASLAPSAASFYRREYGKWEDGKDESGETVYIEYFGEWEMVESQAPEKIFRDFNVTAGKSYQYIIYPKANKNQQRFANNGELSTCAETGNPVRINWNHWSICELIPTENIIGNAPIAKKKYTVNLDNIWFFKYNLETGAQTQNITRNDIQTMGQYAKIGYGKNNYVSGEVTCLLGSELFYYGGGYTERLRKSSVNPSPNDKIKMLHAWRQFVNSNNPKLLRDIKGQSWIVQTISGSNTPKNFYKNQPDTITFSWKQIDSTDQVCIVGGGDDIPMASQIRERKKVI